MRDGQKLSLRSKVSVSICLLLMLSIFIYSARIPAAHSWGATGHQLIENKAERVFSNNSFFSSHHSTLYTWVLYPDQGKFGKSDWHYLDGHSYEPLVYTGGALPWAVENIFENLVRNLQDDNWNNSAQLMGALCHFAGDSTQPLHSTWNYNPGGHHGDYESATLNSHLGEISIPDNYAPQELDNILGAALASLAKSFTFTREGANGGVNLTDFLDNDILWNDWIKSMTENRLRAAVQFSANIWYTAMIQAGLTIQAPTLTSPSDGSSTTDNTPTFTWTSVSGTSSYDFQLASDNNFTINALTVKDLSTTSYTLVNPLTNGGWYWHVRTGDNSADVGLWSQTRSFTISVSTQNPVVVISPNSQSGANGATLNYTVTVTNTENASDNFNLTVSDNDNWGPTVSPTSLLNVSPGENRTSTLGVTIPLGAIGGMIDSITVKATSQADNTVSGSSICTAQVTILRGVSVSISPTSRSGENGAMLTYTVTISNTGNVSDNYSLTDNDNAGWSPSVSPTSLVVAPFGGSGNSTLSVTIPSNAVVGTIDNIWVKATSKDNLAIFDNKSCTAQVTVNWTWTATIHLENLYKVGLDLDVYVENGSKLVVKFYRYDNVTFQAESVIHSITPPENIKENENVPHPKVAEGYPWGTVQIATLVLTTENTENVISTIASFTVYQSDLRARYMAILGAWSANPGLQGTFRAEFMDILKQWASAPL